MKNTFIRQQPPSRRILPSPKKKRIAPPPAAWREPFDYDPTQESPLRITFYDNDPHRMGVETIQVDGEKVKMIEVQRVDGSIQPNIVSGTLADCLAGRPPADMIAQFKTKLDTEAKPETLDLRNLTSEELAIFFAPIAQEHAETFIGGKLYTPTNIIERRTNDQDARLVSSLRLPYCLAFALLLYLADLDDSDDLGSHLDNDADWFVSGYELFQRGVLNQDCTFTPKINPTPEQIIEYGDVFKDNQLAQHKVLLAYDNVLNDVEVRPNANSTYIGCLEHNRDFLDRWFVERYAKTLPEHLKVTEIVKINQKTGEVTTLLGDGKSADAIVDGGPDYLQALMEGRLSKSPSGLQ
jgi:hypothetical protein